MSLRSRHSRLRVQLQPDEEQQQGDADLRHRHDRIGLADQAQHLRPDDRAADDIAECRAEPELAEHGDEDQRRAEHERAVHRARCWRRPRQRLAGVALIRARSSAPRATPGRAAGSRRAATCATARGQAPQGPAIRRDRRGRRRARLPARATARLDVVLAAPLRLPREGWRRPDRRRRRAPVARSPRRGPPRRAGPGA